MTDANLFAELPGPDPAAIPTPDQVPEDQARLTTQLERIERLMRDHEWRTVEEICAITKDPAPSVLAQLGHLRKEKFGSYLVERRHRGDEAHGLYEYRVGDKGAGTPKVRGAEHQVTVRAALAAADGLIGFLAHHRTCAALATGDRQCSCGFVAARKAWLEARTAARKVGL